MSRHNIGLHTIICKTCGDECQVDGEFPKFFAFCDTCGGYADYDMNDYTIEYMANKAECAELCMNIRHAQD